MITVQKPIVHKKSQYWGTTLNRYDVKSRKHYPVVHGFLNNLIIVVPDLAIECDVLKAIPDQTERTQFVLDHWSLESTKSFNHSLEVFEDRDASLHLFEHTFSPVRPLVPPDTALAVDEIVNIETETKPNDVDDDGNGDGDGDRDGSITIICYNIWNFNKEWDERRQKIVSNVLKSEADVLLLQEVRYDTGEERNRGFHRFQMKSMLQDMQQATKEMWQFVFHPSMTYLNEGPFATHEGLSIVSHFPIIDWSVLRLPRDLHDWRDEHQRCVLRATILTPIGNINV